jgi:hypothetical protein
MDRLLHNAPASDVRPQSPQNPTKPGRLHSLVPSQYHTTPPTATALT